MPQNPPSSQQDLLAIALQPIVSFVILGSILTRMSPRFFPRKRSINSRLLDGLSIPFFSAGHRTLTFTQSRITDKPDWLQWVRRVPLQEDAERAAAASANMTQQAGQNHSEWLDLSIPSPDSIKTPGEVLKFKEVCIALLPWHLTFLIVSIQGYQNQYDAGRHDRRGACWDRHSGRGWNRATR